MQLYNTITHKKEEFKPLKDNQVRMYSCGPTVYNYAHIGNLRTYVFMDLLRRTLKLSGFKIKGVMNITDVGHLMSDADEGEDKMVKASAALKKTPQEIADYYTSVFFEDMKRLNIGRPEIVPKATDHIPEMIEFVQQLMEKGFAYETDDGIYFDITKFDGYGKLSGADLEEQLAGARVDVNLGKRHPADFAVWKKAPKEHIMQWQSPWGMGYPGWHIECSAMGRKYLGDVFDLHSGGVDHIPIHHENEIAQSQALTGKQPANFWLHGEFMLVDGGKMSKKLGNTYTLTQLEEKGYQPAIFRFFCLNTHYRKKLNFTFEAMDASKVSYNRLLNSLYQHKTSAEKTPPEVLEQFKSEFFAAVTDDLNIPMALGTLFTMIKQPKSKDIYDLALEMDKIFGIDLQQAKPLDAGESADIPESVAALVKERIAARQNKDYARSDELRDEIEQAGYIIKDLKDGYSLTEK